MRESATRRLRMTSTYARELKNRVKGIIGGPRVGIYRSEIVIASADKLVTGGGKAIASSKVIFNEVCSDMSAALG